MTTRNTDTMKASVPPPAVASTIQQMLENCDNTICVCQWIAWCVCVCVSFCKQKAFFCWCWHSHTRIYFWPWTNVSFQLKCNRVIAHFLASSTIEQKIGNQQQYDDTMNSAHGSVNGRNSINRRSYMKLYYDGWQFYAHFFSYCLLALTLCPFFSLFLKLLNSHACGWKFCKVSKWTTRKQHFATNGSETVCTDVNALQK